MNTVEYKKFFSKRFFGLEMEVGREIHITKIQEVISKNSFVPVKTAFYRATLNNNCWEVKHDGSCGKNVDKFGINEGGYEVVSYKGSSIKDISHICYIGQKIKQAGCLVNKNCGLHLHVDVSDFSTSQMGIMIANWICIEKVLLQAVPSVRKNNKFCTLLQTLRPKFREPVVSGSQIWNFYKPYSNKLHDNFDRRCTMNLVNFYRSLQLKTFKRPTVEFRFPEGTLVSQSIKNWARILINFVNRMALENLNFESLQTVNLTKTLEILGLGGDKDKFYLLSPGLHDSKIWLLKRIIRYASYPHQELIVEAKKILSLLENTDVPEG
jgi:hypothetical protein